MHQVEEYSVEMQPGALYTVQNREEAHIGVSRRDEMRWNAAAADAGWPKPLELIT